MNPSEVRAGDPRLHDFTDLTDVALRSRREVAEGLFIGEGELVIRRAVRAGYPLRTVLTSPRWLGSVSDVVGNAEVLLAPEDVLEEITGFHVHRGALASFARLPPAEPLALLTGRTRVAVLEDINSHTNLGAIFRAAAGLGIEAVLLSPSCADPLYRRAIRVSMGEVFAIPWARLTQWPADLDVLRGMGFTIAALALGEDAVSIRAATLDRIPKLAVLLGAEGPGLSPAAIAQADLQVSIPMTAGVDSLNVAAASAVAFYAAQRGDPAS